MKSYQQFIEQVTATVNVSRRAIPGQATDKSVRTAVDKALANPGQGGYSTASEKGRMKTTVSGTINFSGRFGGGRKKEEEKEKKDKGERRQRKFIQRKEAERAARQAELRKKDTHTTKYKYAVPTGSGGPYGARQASGPNQYTDWKAKGTNSTGGTDYTRTKVVGDPRGTGGTGNVIGAKKYERLFTGGGKYAPPADGSRTSVPDNLGKPFNPKGYQPSKFVR